MFFYIYQTLKSPSDLKAGSKNIVIWWYRANVFAFNYFCHQTEQTGWGPWELPRIRAEFCWDGEMTDLQPQLFCHLSIGQVGKPNCTLPSLPFPVWGSSAFFTRDHLPLVCGGHHNESRGVFYSPTSCFQFKDRAWQNFSAKLTREEGWTHSVVLPSGTFILGGRNDSKSSEFLPVGQTLAWREGPKIPGPGAIYACTVAISDTRFAVIGGELKNRSLVFNTSSWRWTSFTLSSPIMASSPDCLLRNGQILITGGRLPDRSPSASTWKIDPSTWKVTQAADLVQGRFKHRMAELDGRVVVVGGQTNDQNFDSIEELDEVSGTWKNTGVNLKTARNDHSLLILPGTSQDYCWLSLHVNRNVVEILYMLWFVILLLY